MGRLRREHIVKLGNRESSEDAFNVAGISSSGPLVLRNTDFLWGFCFKISE